jgi:prephenate dehydratase
VTRFAYLGPAGTFTEAALVDFMGSEDSSESFGNVTAVLDAVRNGQADAAVVPIENSVEGVVALTLDELAIGDPLVIAAESTLPVTFSLMANTAISIESVKRFATHPHAQAQCRRFLADRLPHAEFIPMSSTAAAAAALADGSADFEAAIAAPIAAQHYGLGTLAENIGDTDGAVTRFILATPPAPVAAPTGHDRTSLVAFIGADHAGALLEILTEFAVRGVNLTFIQSRPTGRELGHYHFVIDAEGHVSEERVGDAIMGLRRICEDVRFLGSYPRADRVVPTLSRGTTDKDFLSAATWLERIRRGDAT